MIEETTDLGCNLIVNLPPRFSSTTLFTVMNIAWRIACNPDIRIRHLAYDIELADYHQDLVWRIINSAEYQCLWSVKAPLNFDYEEVGLELEYPLGNIDDVDLVIVDSPWRSDAKGSDKIELKNRIMEQATFSSAQVIIACPDFLLSQKELAKYRWMHLYVPALVSGKEDYISAFPEKMSVGDLFQMRISNYKVFIEQYQHILDIQ